MNYYTEIVADETLPCSQEDFETLKELMAYREELEDDPDFEWHGMAVELYTELHMFSEESGTLDQIPTDALKHIGAIIKKAKRPYWEFGISYTASRKCPGAFGGRYARIYPNGKLVFSETTWPEPKTKKKK